ncbi:hypothetical protein BDN72DRAFT_838276 [Pluteus cervinus]|uniref:Uncharacterized protein n=1 Tax=Pluteus cervinus TaxID=181527 RepID=A0ACD3AYH1_9AGAR|nr:hypothetical protein BDN72DRAFT_838276 [Pluteus cervinus]
MSDPVAEKSGFLKMYMSSHPDTLVAYAKWYGKVQEPITGAEMSAIDTKSMTLTCKLKAGGTKAVVVKFDPPLAGYEAVKPRLLEMKAHAQEGLGMIKAPKISTFQLSPKDAITSTILVFILIFPGLCPSESASPFFALGIAARDYIGQKVATGLLYTIAVIHILETAYTLSLCRKHTGLLVGALYTLATCAFGFPIIQNFRKRIQDARIDSVMKVE